MFCNLLDELLVGENVHIEFLLECCLVLMVLIFAECNAQSFFTTDLGEDSELFFFDTCGVNP